MTEANEDELGSKIPDIGQPTNLILYGPPGTGKTYYLRDQLIPLYKAKGLVPVEPNPFEFEGFAWWHVITATLSLLGGKAKVDGIMQHPLFQAKAKFQARTTTLRAQVWLELQTHTKTDSKTVHYSRRREPLIFDKQEDSTWLLLPNWKEESPEAAELVASWNSSIPKNSVISNSTDLRKPAVLGDRYMFVTFHQSYAYEDFVEGIRPEPDIDSGELRYDVKPGVFRRICALAKADPSQRYALFIDEINRGNIAKIFGELITLIEDDKRSVHDLEGRLVMGMELILPYSGERFGVPTNLDIYGTMNTADRSIALLDVALRRRFRFQEMPPRPEVIMGTQEDGKISDGEGGWFDLRSLLVILNRRLLLLRDRDHLLGHSYLMRCQNLDDVRVVLRDQILPLLQEYFYEDYGRIQRILGDIGPGGVEHPDAIIRTEPLSYRELLGGDDDEALEGKKAYRVSDSREWSATILKRIYGG